MSIYYFNTLQVVDYELCTVFRYSLLERQVFCKMLNIYYQILLFFDKKQEKTYLCIRKELKWDLKDCPNL